MSAKPLTCGICRQDHGEYERLVYSYAEGSGPGVPFGTTTGPFHDHDILTRHKRLVHYEEYKAAKAQARITRAANLRAEADLKAQTKARMEAASERLVEVNWPSTTIEMFQKHGIEHKVEYRMVPTYQAEPKLARRPSQTALADIAEAERHIRTWQAELERCKADAWESGSPVTEAEIQAARAAGEVTA